MAAQVLAEGFQPFQDFACSVLRPPGEKRVENGQFQDFQDGDDPFRLPGGQPAFFDGVKNIQAHTHGDGFRMAQRIAGHGFHVVGGPVAEVQGAA